VTAVTRYVPRHLRRPARTPRIAASLLLAATPLAGFSLPTSTPPPVWAAVGAGVGPVEPAPGTVGPTPVPTVPPMAPLPVQTAPPKPPAWVSPLAADVCRPPSGGGQWHAPRDDNRDGITDRLHAGIDLGMIEGLGTGTPIRSVGAGVVIAAGPSGGAGNRVNIRHADGAVTQYQHLSRIDVWSGSVKAGQQIGLMGMTGGGLISGPHLHLGVVVNGSNVNPLPWLLERGVDLRC